MRRHLVATTLAALVASTTAFAPAVSQQQAETDHQIAFSEDGTQTVAGGAPGGINLTGFTEGAVRCSSEPDAYCETILVTVEQPVDDVDPEQIDFGLGALTVALVSDVPGGDFDLYVRDSDADGSRGTEVANSGNAPGCAQLCGSAPDPAGLYVNQCDGTDECVEVGVSTTDLPGGGTAHFLVEVVYFAAPSTYTATLAYERTDGAGATDDSGDPGSDTGDATAPEGPAPAVEKLDVTGGSEKTGDWNNGQHPEVGDALGQDIEAAFIEYAEDTFTFTIDVTSLPAAGGMPEFTRYGWSFLYDDVEFELDGKFTNYSRGACDPTAGTCPPPRDPGIGYFALRGNCVTNEGNVTTCDELGGVNATFDPGDGTITIPISAELLAPEGVRACDTITGTASLFGGSVWSAPTAFVSSSAFPHDQAGHYVPLVVPHADPMLSC